MQLYSFNTVYEHNGKIREEVSQIVKLVRMDRLTHYTLSGVMS